MKRRTLSRMLFSGSIGIWPREARRKASAAGYIVSHTTRPEIARRATTGSSAHHLRRASTRFWTRATPEQALLDKEKFRQLANAIRLLERGERECLLLRAGGLRYREIGEVLGVPTSTVADTVDRAIKKLAEKCNV